MFVTNHDRLKPCGDRQVPAWITKWRENPLAGGNPLDRVDSGVYCYCKQPWSGRFMIQCDYCDEWYHGSCVDVTATEAVNIQKYKCNSCKKSNTTP